jgi:hypothetical protein
MAGRRGYRAIPIKFKQSGDVSIYASHRVADALEEITDKTDLYDGVRLVQILEAAYQQGKKDGAREVFETVDKSLAATKRQIRHKPPGRPKKRAIAA